MMKRMRRYYMDGQKEENLDIQKLKYKIKMISRQKKKYNNLLLLNFLLIMSILFITKNVTINLWLSLSAFLITIIVGIYVLIKVKQCRDLLGVLLKNFIKKTAQMGSNNNNQYKVSRLQDVYTYITIIINISLISHTLSLSLI